MSKRFKLLLTWNNAKWVEFNLIGKVHFWNLRDPPPYKNYLHFYISRHFQVETPKDKNVVKKKVEIRFLAILIVCFLLSTSHDNSAKFMCTPAPNASASHPVLVYWSSARSLQ